MKFTGISLIISIFSFIGIGITLDSETTKSDEKEIVAAEEQPKETEEEKATREAKEAEEKALAEQKAKEEAEAKEKAAKKANAQTIQYAQLKKNPDRYSGEYVKYTGEILQIIEGDEITHIRLAVTP